MSTGMYRQTGGFFEKVHPVTKILSLGLAFLPPLLATRAVDLLLYAGLLGVAVCVAGAWGNVKRLAGLMAILFLASLLLWGILQGGPGPRLRWGPLSVSQEGWKYGIAVGLRLNCFLLAALVFLTSTRIEDFTFGLARLGMPFAASFALSLAFRLTPLFMETAHTIVLAQRARGLDLEAGGMLRRARRYVPIIVPILLSSLMRADQLAVALESKGFGRAGRRTVLLEYPITWRDFLLIGVVLIAVAWMVIHFGAARLE